MKLFKYITIAFSSLFMCGCSDYLDNAPDDTLTMEMVLSLIHISEPTRH